MKAWHFVSKTLRDGSPIPKDGELLKLAGEPILCKQGLHASLEPFDALRYAQGNVLCYVELGGKILEAKDKVVGTERTIIARMDAEEMLRFYARMQALSVVHLWGAPDVVLDYLMTGEGRAAAASATCIAVRDTARTAAEYAAGYAAVATARGAARTATEAPASAAAWTVARTATEAAAWTAKRATARSEFNALVYECFEGAMK